MSNLHPRPRLLPASEGGLDKPVGPVVTEGDELVGNDHLYCEGLFSVSLRGVSEKGMLTCHALGKSESMETSYPLLWGLPKFQSGEMEQLGAF